MNKKELQNILSEVLLPKGFKKKGNYWVINGDEVSKMFNLQKSEYGNFFYINYGYILRSIPLDNEMMHIYNRVTSSDLDKKSRIKFLLDLGSDVWDYDRTKELIEIVSSTATKMCEVNTEKDLLQELKKRPQLNDISLAVKKHFDLE